MSAKIKKLCVVLIKDRLWLLLQVEFIVEIGLNFMIS